VHVCQLQSVSDSTIFRAKPSKVHSLTDSIKKVFV